jgi:hypothetical protein
MSEFEDFLKLVAEGKQDYKQNDSLASLEYRDFGPDIGYDVDPFNLLITSQPRENYRI